MLTSETADSSRVLAGGCERLGMTSAFLEWISRCHLERGEGWQYGEVFNSNLTETWQLKGYFLASPSLYMYLMEGL